MFIVNDDNSIYVTRGDIVVLGITAEDDGKPYVFKAGDLLRIKVFGKKDCENVVLQKDFPITTATETAEIYLDENDTKIGGVISKPVDYWYEVELNPLSDPQTIIGYDDEGAKVFKLFPEGKDLTDFPDITPEDIPVVDEEFDLASERPLANRVIARAVYRLDKHIKVVSGVLPEDFGAIGDGVSDDTEAFIRALVAVENGGTLRLSDSVYLLRERIEITKNISVVGGTITGKGLRIKGADVTLNGMVLKDIDKNAIVTEGNAKLTVCNCRFENIGTTSDLDVTYEGCGIHSSGGYELKVYDCEFTGCHGHGAVFCHDGGTLIVKDSYFDSNHYRAISTFGTEVIKGAISGNYINDCGKPNTTGSGVGCNGIFAPNGYGIVCENNTILNSRENAIEGAFLKIVGNYIDGTGVEKDTKPTPSIEGICYSPSAPAYVANNVVLNAGGSGIKTYRESALNNVVYIVGNIVRGSGENAIDIGSAVSVDNTHIIDNIVDSYVKVTNSKRTNVYRGDILHLDIVGNIDVSKNNSVYDFHHYFEKLEPFTYSNCTPNIKESGGEKYVEVVYEKYSRLECALPSLANTYHIINFYLYGKGKFDVNLQKNNTYYKTIFSVDSNEFVDKQKAVGLLGALSDKFKVTIEFKSQANSGDNASCIKAVDMQIYR